MKKLLSYILIFLLVISCGRNDEDFREDAILTALNYLNNNSCQEAIDILEEAGRDVHNIFYMKALASGFACKAGYSTGNIITNDIPNVSAANASLLGVFAAFSNASSMDAPDNDGHDNLQTAIDLLLYAGGLDEAKDPTIARRSTAMTAGEAIEVNTFLMFLLMDQLGRFVHFYGDTDAVGLKAAGNRKNNECFIYYDRTIVLAAPALTLGSYLTTIQGVQGNDCGDNADSDADTLVDEGHPDLGVSSASLNVSRLCEGVVLYNNFRKVLSSVISSTTSTELGSLGDITTVLNTVIDNLTTARSAASPTINTLAETLSKTKCIADNTADTSDLQTFYAYVYESLLY